MTEVLLASRRATTPGAALEADPTGKAPGTVPTPLSAPTSAPLSGGKTDPPSEKRISPVPDFASDKYLKPLKAIELEDL